MIPLLLLLYNNGVLYIQLTNYFPSATTTIITGHQ